MNKEYIEEITIANAATNYPGIDVSAIRDYMTGRTPTHFKPRKKTNADRIRSMSDEELADEIYAWHLLTACRSREWILDWLKKEY